MINNNISEEIENVENVESNDEENQAQVVNDFVSNNSNVNTPTSNLFEEELLQQLQEFGPRFSEF